MDTLVSNICRQSLPYIVALYNFYSFQDVIFEENTLLHVWNSQTLQIPWLWRHRKQVLGWHTFSKCDKTQFDSRFKSQFQQPYLLFTSNWHRVDYQFPVRKLHLVIFLRPSVHIRSLPTIYRFSVLSYQARNPHQHLPNIISVGMKYQSC